MDPVALSVFASRLEAICDEMGAALRRASFSSNIKDRLDYSCALFDASGALCAQAAHIPVHLGSMAYAMAGLVRTREWAAGDMVMLNDPFLGGTHLPDVTVVAPVLVQGQLAAFVTNRAHHADIGSDSPGSMPVSRTLDEEGIVIPPTRVVRDGELEEAALVPILARTSRPRDTYADLVAQLSANRIGAARLEELLAAMGADGFAEALADLNRYAERLAVSGLAGIPAGTYRFEDVLDDDGGRACVSSTR